MSSKLVSNAIRFGIKNHDSAVKLKRVQLLVEDRFNKGAALTLPEARKSPFRLNRMQVARPDSRIMLVLV